MDLRDKKNLVLVLGSFYPFPSAIGEIAAFFADFLKDDYKISVICIQKADKKASGLFWKNTEVYALTQTRLRWTQLAEEKSQKSKSPFKKMFYRLIRDFMRGIGKIQSTFFYIDNCYWYSKKAKKQLDKLNSKNRIDAVISLSSPIESHFASRKFKKENPDVRWVAYFGDPFVNPQFKKNIFISMKTLERIQSDIIENADYALMTEEIYEKWNPKHAHCGKKTAALPYILKEDIFKNSSCSEINFDSSNIHVVYAGAFYKDIRNPEYALKVFDAATRRSDIMLHLFSQGNCGDTVEKYSQKSGGKIINHGIVSKEELLSIYKKADALLNIGNSTDAYNPSKVFEYISTCKPIISFYQNGLVSNELSRYPFAVQIGFDGDIDADAEKIISFCSSTLNQSVDFAELENLFHEHTAKSIKNKLEIALK